MTYLLAFGVFLILILLMSIGVIFRRRSIKGNCGGLANLGVEKACNCKTVCEGGEKRPEKTLYQIEEPQKSGPGSDHS